MARKQRNAHKLCKSIGARLIQVIEKDLGWSLARAAKELDYANATTLYAVKRGTSVPDPVRLVLAAHRIRDKSGRFLDLHWIFTGEGQPFLNKDHSMPARDHGDQYIDIIKLLDGLSEEKKTALRVLLRNGN